MIFYIVHYYLGWVPGRSFHSLSWLIDFVRIDVYNCLRLLFCAGGNLFLSKDWLIIIILGIPLSFSPPPVKPRLESFQLKHTVSQSHILPLALKVTRCLHSIRENSPLLLVEESRECVNWEFHPHPSVGSTLLSQRVWARNKITGVLLSLSWPGPYPHNLCVPFPRMKVGSKYSSRAILAQRLYESEEG